MPVRGGLALTGNAPNRPARTLPAPAPRKSRSTSAGLSGSDGNDARGRRGLHHHDDGDQEAQRHQPRPLLGREIRQGRRRQRCRHGADHGDALAFEAGADHGERRRDQPDQRAGNFGADRLPTPATTASTPKPDAERVEVGRAELPRQLADAVEHRPARRRQAEHAGHLRHQDVHGDAGEKADRHRRRQQIGDPAQAEQAADDEDDADHQRQRHRERLIVRRAGGGHQQQVRRRRSA